jgi:hypothetical protein
MSYTDPSGYFSLKSLYKGLMKADGRWAAHKFTSKHPWMHTAGMTAISLFVPGGWNILASAHANYDHTFVQTGSLNKAFRTGAITAVTAYGLSEIGASDYWGEAGSVQNIAANAVVGGISAELQGGNFGHGFWSAGFASAAKPMIYGQWGYSPDNRTQRVVASATIGGTASVISGGKFANGAMTGAFTQLYNGETYAAKKWNQIQAFTKDLYDNYASSSFKVLGGASQAIGGGIIGAAGLGMSELGIGIPVAAFGGLVFMDGINNFAIGLTEMIATYQGESCPAHICTSIIQQTAVSVMGDNIGMNAYRAFSLATPTRIGTGVWQLDAFNDAMTVTNSVMLPVEAWSDDKN